MLFRAAQIRKIQRINLPDAPRIATSRMSSGPTYCYAVEPFDKVTRWEEYPPAQVGISLRWLMPPARNKARSFQFVLKAYCQFVCHCSVTIMCHANLGARSGVDPEWPLIHFAVGAMRPSRHPTDSIQLRHDQWNQSAARSPQPKPRRRSNPERGQGFAAANRRCSLARFPAATMQRQQFLWLSIQT